jgi:hypothetical protein
VEVLPVASVCPDNGGSRGDVDVEWLECIVDYGDGISWICAMTERSGELGCGKNDYGNKNGSWCGLHYPEYRKRGSRPFDEATSMEILILA